MKVNHVYFRWSTKFQFTYIRAQKKLKQYLVIDKRIYNQMSSP
jgi:hypothetical protein